MTTELSLASGTSSPRSSSSRDQASRHDENLAPAGRPRWRRPAVVLPLMLVAALLLFPVVANAAMTTLAAHDHGILDITIDRVTVDLDQPRFHDLHPHFHVHPGHGNLWHHHPTGLTDVLSFEPLTVSEALAGMGVRLTADGLHFDGNHYRVGDPGVTVSIRVNDAEVDVDGRIVADGDRISVEIATPSG